VAVAKNHGNGNPTKISKILLPIDDDTAISPLPALATITEVNRSGTEVPAANTVRPITPSGIPAIFPITVAHQTMQNEYTANQKMDIAKAIGQYGFHFGFRISGTVKYRENIIGAVIT